MSSHLPYFLQKGNIHAVPIIHYNMEMAAQVKIAFDTLKPDCVAVELPETMQAKMLHAASRLPDISLVLTYAQDHTPIYFMCEPCDAIFEALRSAAEAQVPAYCIDLDIDHYPEVRESIPDPYAIQRLGLKVYYEIYEQSRLQNTWGSSPFDAERELYMARRLKELSLRYERILFVCGMAHLASILKLIDQRSFPDLYHADREVIELCTLTPESSREVLAEWGYLSTHYERVREKMVQNGPLDRQKVIFSLYKEAANLYVHDRGEAFPGYHFRNLMKFARNYSLVGGLLMPNLFRILGVAKGCVDHNYAYEVWELATTYPYRRNIDGLLELDLSIEEVWGASESIRFFLKEKGRKGSVIPRSKKERGPFHFRPLHALRICSYPPEDVVIEHFGHFLKEKGCQILKEEGARTIPFSTSLEDGIDTKETIRHWHERKIYVKARGKPPAQVGSICVIFDEDKPEEGKVYKEKYPWCTTWLGEHEQESDMSFYATTLGEHIVGPGISRCFYGGLMMSYPPRRLNDVWRDPDYQKCQGKAEVLLMAAIDYAMQPVIVYVASSPPRKFFKNFAERFGKKVVYHPIGQLSPVTLEKLRIFHVLDGPDRREWAKQYI